MNLIDVGLIVEREAARVQGLLDVAEALKSIGTMQQMADEAQARNTDLNSKNDALTAELYELTPKVEAAREDANTLLDSAKAEARKLSEDSAAQAALDAKAIADDIVSKAQTQVQNIVDAGNQASVVATERNAALQEQTDALNLTIAGLNADIDRLTQDKASLESALADIKSKFA